MKEEIERRRAEAAEKRQKVEDVMDGEDRPFKCVSPRGSSLKVSPQFLRSHFCLVSVQFYLPSNILLGPVLRSYFFNIVLAQHIYSL